jgi:hypothetical protein
MNAINLSVNENVELSSTEANVPLLAIEAANELDELIEGRITDLNSVKGLAEILRRSFKLGQPIGQKQGFVDSGTVAVFSQAIDESVTGHQIVTLDDLVARALEIVNNLENTAAGKDDIGINKMRDFCIALSNSAAAYQQSVYELRPSHPFRT